MNSDKDQLTGHEYDGIREYDNPLPSWWLATFLATIIFGSLYALHYMSGSGPGLKEELDAAMKEIEMHRAHAPNSGLSAEALAEEIKKVDLAAAAEVFKGKCAACHGEALQGVIGPNLTDEYWLHGKGSPAEIEGVVRGGVVDKGMPAWGEMLKPEELVMVTAYILSKQDTHPANAKPPQGEKVR